MCTLNDISLILILRPPAVIKDVYSLLFLYVEGKKPNLDIFCFSRGPVVIDNRAS